MPKATAQATGKVTGIKGSQVAEQEVRETVEFDLELGNGATQVSNTRGFKKWASDREHGLTVEATVAVTLTCNQDERTIRLAIKKAGNMAERYARKGIKEMQEYFDNG